MTAYTVAMREKGSRAPYSYISEDLRVVRETKLCKPLSREEAEAAKQRLIQGAKEVGRLIECRIVRISGRAP